MCELRSAHVPPVRALVSGAAGKPTVDYSVVGKGSDLLYNEFIVYDAAQARFLVARATDAFASPWRCGEPRLIEL